MSKIRVYELAKQLNITSKSLIAQLKDLDIKIVNHMSTIDSEQAELIKELLNDETSENKVNQKYNNEIKKTENKKKDKGINKKEKKAYSKKQDENKNYASEKQNKQVNSNLENKELKKIKLPPSIKVGEFSDKISRPPSEVIKKLMLLGIMATINQEIDFDSASMIAEEFGYIAIEDKENNHQEDFIVQEKEDKPEDLVKRPPVITVMGHVDHGKTSLLDAIRKTKITQKEAGGITQHIGAYMVNINGEKITFLDTPGHEAFTAMRSRGASITDIAVLVVAADDGVMPQTVEAINHAKAANVPIIVAINKIDKSTASPDKIKQELTEYGLIPEEWGGDTICVPVSAVTHEGIDNLLEMILLVAEMQELKANPNKRARGSVIEAKLEKGRGTVATLLVETGTIHIGDAIVAGTAHGRVRAMIDDKGKRIKKAGPSMPIEILGLSEVPVPGETFYVVKDDKLARNIAEKNKEVIRERQLNQTQKISLDDLFTKIKEGEVKEISVIIKADVQGSIEALKQSLERLSNDEVKIKIIHSGVGAISESDVMLASASNAIIVGFNVRPDNNAQNLAEKEKVDIRLYRVIYNAIEDMQDAMKGILEPEYKEQVVGRAEVRQIFRVPNIGTIAGCHVIDGKINRNNQVRIIRDGIVIHEGSISSLKRFKDDVKEIASGYECGLGIENYNDIKEGDIIEGFTMIEVSK
ncbi:translation initiation factor IF-2 [Garciella nitratireducens]|uniref:Translation initiation factor IF-2 n=1 Tax=Garciella nitratireducens DSM 15102 TaxID=1121911 RepID=A0A1T4JWP1_9FIRM|nr:translation initiation factor IF-2 [Garciella nitratireducens]SJZ34524.1 translation initiation factor IF-2 [Garciella nitratireducens DSM 15102]